MRYTRLKAIYQGGEILIKIKLLQITKLYGRRNIKIEFENITFLTGINGSGKSTILNIIQALLVKDIEYFKKLNFEKIIFHIEMKGNSQRIGIEKASLERDFEKISFESNKVHFVNNQGLSEEKVKKLKIADEKNFNLNEEEFNLLLKENLSPLEKINDIIEKLLIDKFGKRTLFEEFQIQFVDIYNEINKNHESEEYLTEITKLIAEILKKEEISSVIVSRLTELCVKAIQNLKLNSEILFKLIDLMNTLNLYQKYNNHILDKIIGQINKFFLSSWKELKINELKRRLEINDYLTENKTVKDVYESLYKLSSGERNIIIFIFNLYFSSEGIYLLDEPENSLHLDWQLTFSKFLKSFIEEYPEKQIILATHSPDIIQKFSSENFVVLYPYEKRKENV